MRLAPFASAEGMHQAARIERIARAGAAASGPGFTPQGLPASSSTHPSLPPLSAPRPPLDHSSGPGAVAFGRTGDLSATGPARGPARRGGLVAVVMALTILGALCGGVGVWVVARTRAAAPASSLARATDAPPSAGGAPLGVASPAVASGAEAATGSPVASAASTLSSSDGPPGAASSGGTRRGPPARPPALGGHGRVPPGGAASAQGGGAATVVTTPAVPATPSPKPDPTEDRR